MTDTVSPANNDELVRELLLEKYEPIAIVGMGLRFPGGTETPEGFAELLRAGRSGIEPIPLDRWDVEGLHSDEPGAKGKILPHSGGFVRSLDQFDPKFFNISPKEADYIDPQQRLLLACAWEALESANIDPAALRDGDGGVYVSICQFDYALEAEKLTAPELEGAIGTGTAHSAACGRLSYFLGWRGPCLSVDTACSGSLVALHLAMQGLRRRECGIALCGGVNSVHHPRNHIVFSQAGMLCRDGLCKTFDDGADGYGRSEGCGMVVLKRLSDAKRDGDTVLALVRGSSVGQDGASGGLTVPNGTAQVAVMRAALASAMLEPKDIQYVEAHGTGTPLGDPIELGAIATVFSESHTVDAPVVVGSVKTNIGHMEGAAGIGGVMKVVLQLQDKVIYPHLHLKTPSRHIPWERYAVTVPTQPRAWQATRRRALVNSFAFAGTISTVVLEEAPPVAAETAEAAEARRRDCHPIFTISAKSLASLRAQAAQVRRFLDRHPDMPIAELCATTNLGRSHFPLRLAGAVTSRAELQQLLDQHLAAPKPEVTARGELRGRPIAFLFTGQGAQYAGMGTALYAQYPVFRRHLDECDRLFAPYLGRSIREIILGEAAGSEQEIHQTIFTQPALFALEYAVAELWMSWGQLPSVLLGHSIGEIVAATIAGLFTLADAVKLVAARGRLMQSVSAPGGMVAVRAAAEVVAPVLEGYDDVRFGAINSPEQCVISGGIASLAAISDALTARGIPAKSLPVSHAFHSPLMAEVFGAFRDALRDIVFHEPTRSLVSNLTGQVVTLAEVGTPEYWVRHIGEPVNFAAGMRCVQARGRHVFIEVGPSAALIGMGKQCGDPSPHLWLSSLDPKDQAGATIRASLVRAYTAGLSVAWAAYHEGRPRRLLSLPTYPFDNKRYWLPVAAKQGPAKRTAAAHDHHPLLGSEISTLEQRARGEREFRVELDAASPAYLADHVVMGQVVFPGAGYVEILLALEDAVFGETSRVLREIEILEPLFLGADAPAEVRTRLRPSSDDQASVQIVSRVAGPRGPQEMIERVHVTATIGGAPEAGPTLAGVVARMRTAAQQRGPAEAVRRSEELYADLLDLGLAYGPEFQRVREITRYPGGLAIGELRGIDTPVAEHVPASVLDGAMQTLAGVIDLGDAYLPVGFERIELLKKPKADLVSWLQLTKADPAALTADLVVLENTRPVLIMQGLRLRRVASTGDVTRRRLYEPRWVPQPLAAPKPAGGKREVLVVHRDAAELASLVRSLEAAGLGPTVAADPASARRILTEQPTITELCWFWHTQPDLRGVARLRAECERNYRDLLELVVALEGLGHRRNLRLRLVTQGAQWLPTDLPTDTADDRRPDHLAAGSLWGFGAVLLSEYPAFRPTLLDLPAPRGGGGSPDYQPLIDELTAEDPDPGEFQVAYRAGARHVRRIAPLGRPARPDNHDDHADHADHIAAAGAPANPGPVPAERAPLTIRPDETYLITGGLGALGMATARGLVSAGARHVAVLGRRQVPPDEVARLAARLGDGVELIVYQGDVASPADVEHIMRLLAERSAPLGGIIHAAGVLADAPAAKQTWDTIDRVLAPKVYGTWLLHEALARTPSVRFFMAYSSISSVVGPAGQCNYAAGNAFMDVLMSWRTASGLPGQSVNWGPWADVGMAAALGAPQRKAIEDHGVSFLRPSQAIRTLLGPVGPSAGQRIVCEFDWERFVANQPVANALYQQVRPKVGPRARTTARTIDLAALVALPKAEREAAIRAILQARLAAILRFDSPDDVEVDARFVELGLDSLAAVELKNALEAAFRIPLATSALFDHPAIRTLAAFLSGELAPGANEPAPTAAPADDVRKLSDTEADAELAALRELAL